MMTRIKAIVPQRYNMISPLPSFNVKKGVYSSVASTVDCSFSCNSCSFFCHSIQESCSF